MSSQSGRGQVFYTLWSNVFKTQFYSKIPEKQNICYSKAGCPRRSPHVGLDVYSKKDWHAIDTLFCRRNLSDYTLRKLNCKKL